MPFKSHIRFSFYHHVHVWLFLFLMCCGPFAYLLYIAQQKTVTQSCWVMTLAWFFGMMIWAWYVDRRCSTEKLSFMDGMLYVTSSAAMGLVNLSFFLIFPALAVVFLLASLLTFVGMLLGKPEITQHKFGQIIAFCYRHRLIK